MPFQLLLHFDLALLLLSTCKPHVVVAVILLIIFPAYYRNEHDIYKVEEQESQEEVNDFFLSKLKKEGRKKFIL